jgi:hypothetical protein
MMCVGLDLASVRNRGFSIERGGRRAQRAIAAKRPLAKKGQAGKSSLKGRKRDGVPHALDDAPGGGISQPIDPI